MKTILCSIIILISLTSFASEKETKKTDRNPTATQFKGDVETRTERVDGTDVLQIIDRTHGVVCYGRTYQSGSMSCVHVPKFTNQ